MLDLAGIFPCNLFIDAQLNKKLSQLLYAPENAFRPDGVYLRFPVKTLQSAFQALLGFKGRGKEALGHIHLLHKEIRPGKFFRNVEATAENAAFLDHTTGF